jgi:membrane fusion protein, multidrug efflux system
MTKNVPLSHSGILVISAAALTLAGCGSKPQAQAAENMEMPTPAVTVAAATTKDVPVYLDEIGKNGAYESVMVTPQVAGRVTERDFQDGAELKKGQLLFVIDPRPYQAAVDSAQAQLAQAKAALDLAQTQLKMYDTLNDSRAVSQLDYQTKKNAVEVDQAQIQAAQASAETAKLNLDYCYIHSPIDGRAGARLVDVGNVVTANSSSLLSIQRIDPIYADFTVTEADLAQVRANMAHGTLRTIVRLPADPENAGRSGSLTFLDNAVQNATGTVNLRATVPNTDHHFWPGQFVNVRLVLATDKNAVLIPNQATQISQRGPYVLVVKSDSSAEIRPVVLGQRQGDNVVVTNGVAPGDRVIVTGQSTVIPGMKVRVESGVPSQSPSGGAPAAAGGSRGN